MLVVHVSNHLRVLLCSFKSLCGQPLVSHAHTPTHTPFNTHQAWEGYKPELLGSNLYPNEVVSDFAFIPFGGGARKCIGDQFAFLEASVAFAMLLRRFTFRLAGTPESVGMATGATIHTANGLQMRVTARTQGASTPPQQAQPATAA